jgi:hypothetical protein
MDEFGCREALAKLGFSDDETDLVLASAANGKLKHLVTDKPEFYKVVVNRVTLDPAKFKAGARKKLAESAA